MERFVYFVEAPSVNLIKIGSSNDPERRFSELQLLSPVTLEVLGVTAGGYEREMALHAMFADLRSHGEWFHATKELRRFVNMHALAYLWNTADKRAKRWFLEQITERPIEISDPKLDNAFDVSEWEAETLPHRAVPRAPDGTA